jgi:hypothetical protein
MGNAFQQLFSYVSTHLSTRRTMRLLDLLLVFKSFKKDHQLFQDKPFANSPSVEGLQIADFEGRHGCIDRK